MHVVLPGGGGFRNHLLSIKKKKKNHKKPKTSSLHAANWMKVMHEKLRKGMLI